MNNTSEFIISGFLLDEQGKNLEGAVIIDGYQGSPDVSTNADGYFKVHFNKLSIWDIMFRHALYIFVKEGNRTQGKMLYRFVMRRNKELILKIFPFSKKVVESWQPIGA